MTPTRPSSSSSRLLESPPFSTTSLSRLQSIYSDISRQKYSNPTSYHANVEWWRKALESIVSGALMDVTDGERPGTRLALSAGRPLIDQVRVQGVGKPLGLGAVVLIGYGTSKTELRLTKTLIPFAQFMAATESVYDPGWLPARVVAYVVGKPLWWALEQLGIVGEDSGSGGTKETEWWGEYVVLRLVERAADAVIDKQKGKVGGPGDGLYSLEGFAQEFAGVVGGDEVLSVVDRKVLVRYLERDRRVVVVDNEVIKFVDANVSPERRVINAVDRGVLELKSAVENMHAQVDGLQQKIDESTQKASSALRQKRKSMALSCLRSRKHLEDLMTKRLGSLEILESTLIRVEAAAGDIEIMKSYESSTATLRTILAHPSLQREKIDETMDAVAEATAEARDVDDAIRIGGDGALGVEDVATDEALEAALRELVKEAGGDNEEEDVDVEKLKRDDLKVPVGVADVAERIAIRE